MDTICCTPILTGTITEDDATDLAGVLKALADPVRLRLVSVVAEAGEACACDLPAILDRAQPTVSHHLSQLVKAGILEREQRGKWAWFSVNEDRIAQVRAVLG
ncbi:MAG: metalloregulator ArsR/SmtB family transcription factor [Actinomycetota bacterium]